MHAVLWYSIKQRFEYGVCISMSIIDECIYCKEIGTIYLTLQTHTMIKLVAPLVMHQTLNLSPSFLT